MSTETDKRVLEAAQRAWEAMAPLRQRRRRYARFTYGDQWGDPATDPRTGRSTTEGALAARAGRQPLTNNLIRRLVKAVVGRFRQNQNDQRQGKDEASDMLAALRRANRLDELDARCLEEFLISGVALQCVYVERRMGGTGVWVDAVSPQEFFINRVRDPRGFDTELVGRLRQMSPSEVVMRYSRGSASRAAMLRQLYAGLEDASAVYATDNFCSRGADADGDGASASFFHAPAGRCRVIEVWTLECRQRLLCHDPSTATLTCHDVAQETRLLAQNRRRCRQGLPQLQLRWETYTVWHCRHLAPDGTLLLEADSPLPSGRHPFALKLYPLLDGEVHSLVEDVIDQQKYVNRLISMMDHAMGTAAKGALLFPKGSRVEGQKWEDICRMWSQPGAVIPYTPLPGGGEPHTVVTPVADLGAQQLLQTQIQLFEDVSGVSSALLGHPTSGNVGAERYENQVRQASASIADLMETYSDFLSDRDALLADASLLFTNDK